MMVSMGPPGKSAVPTAPTGYPPGTTLPSVLMTLSRITRHSGVLFEPCWWVGRAAIPRCATRLVIRALPGARLAAGRALQMRAGGRDFVLEAEGAPDRSAWMRALEDAQREHPRWDADAESADGTRA